MPPHDSPNELLQNARNSPGDVALTDVINKFKTANSVQHRVATETLLLIGNDDPERIDVAMTYLEPLLEDDDTDMRNATAHLVATVASEHPESVTPIVPVIIDRLDDTVSVQGDLIRTLAHIARVSPGDVAPAVPLLGDNLDSEFPFIRKSAVDAISSIERELPDEVIPLVPDLIDILADRPDTVPGEVLNEIENPHMRQERRQRDAQTRIRNETCRQTVALILAGIGDSHPNALVEHVPRFVDIVETEENPAVRATEIDLCGRIALEYPTDMIPIHESLYSILIESEYTMVQATSAWTLGILADDYPVAVADSVRPALPTLIDLLGEDLYTNGAVIGLLAYVAEQYPEAVKPAVPTLLELANDGHESVRGSVVWVLGFVGGDDAINALETVLETDPDPAVRQAATEALQRVNGE